MDLLNEIKRTIDGAATDVEKQSKAVEYITSLDFSDNDMRASGMAAVAHYLNQVQENAELSLTDVKSIVTIISKIIMQDYGLKDIKLDIWAFNDNAFKFYEKNGFQIERIYLDYTIK